MVSDWETPPEVQQVAQPDSVAEPVPEPQPQPGDLPQVAPEPPPQMFAPAAPLARPNLPEPPPLPRIEPAQLDLPDLQEFAPPQIDPESALTLQASARPDARPKRRQPDAQSAAQPRAPEPQRQTAPAAARPAPQPAQPAQRAGQGGQAQASRPGGGSGGASAATRASALAQWSAQIQTCLARQLSRVSGGRGGRVAVNISVGRDGRVQGAALAGGTGDARIDAQVLRGIQRVRSCPAAPAALTDPSHTFQQPFTIR